MAKTSFLATHTGCHDAPSQAWPPCAAGGQAVDVDSCDLPAPHTHLCCTLLGCCCQCLCTLGQLLLLLLQLMPQRVKLLLSLQCSNSYTQHACRFLPAVGCGQNPVGERRFACAYAMDRESNAAPSYGPRTPAPAPPPAAPAVPAERPVQPAAPPGLRPHEQHCHEQPAAARCMKHMFQLSQT